MHGHMIRMVVAAVRIEGEDDLRPHLAYQRADRGFDIEHVDVRQGTPVVMALALLPPRIMKPQQHGRLDAQPRARDAQFPDAQRGQIRHRSDRGVRLARFAIGRARERDAHATLAQMRENAAVKNLVVRVSQHGEERRLTRQCHGVTPRGRA
jgi:hypothetical protein